MFGRKKRKASVVKFDRTHQRAILRCSICTGERVAGFKDIDTGRFTDVMLIRTDADLEEFMRTYQLTGAEIAREY